MMDTPEIKKIIKKFFKLVNTMDNPSESLVINGDIIEDHPFLQLASFYASVEPEEIRRYVRQFQLIYVEVKAIFNQSFAQVFTEAAFDLEDISQFENLGKTYLQFWNEFNRLMQEKKFNLNIKDLLEAYTAQYEHLVKIIVIAVRILYYCQFKIDLPNLKIKKAKLYLQKSNKDFGLIYNKYVQPELRNAYAHHGWIQIDEGRFYLISNPEEILMKNMLSEKLDRLTWFFVFFGYIFLLEPMLTYLKRTDLLKEVCDYLEQSQDSNGN